MLFLPKFVLLLVFILAPISCLASDQAQTPTTMNLTLQDLNGSSFQTSSFAGNILVVMFMATWAVYTSEIAQNVYRIFQNNSFSNVIFLTVTIDPTHDTSSVLENFINENNLSTYAFNNSQWIWARDVNLEYSNYAVTNVPDSFLVNQNSVIIDHHLGSMSYDFIYQWITTISTSSSFPAISTTNFYFSPYFLLFFLPLIVFRKKRKY